VGERVEVLVEGPSRRGGAQCSGRDPQHRVVNFAAEGADPAPGSLVELAIVEATPHSLIGELPAGESRPAARPPVKDGLRRADEAGDPRVARPRGAAPLALPGV
jgi:tRNA-2-methylthio-N6-dimethylallyladenosine synthase